MSLRYYRMPRLVVLNPGNSALEAARAIESNDIGAVVIQDRNEVVGIVTDRDLTIRVVGRGLDPTTTSIGQVMTSPVATLSLIDSQADAVRVMRERNIRRIPLVDAGKLAGIVTLDDLLLDEAAPLDQLAAVVQSQIGQGGPLDGARSPAARRSAARAQATYGRYLNQVRADADLESADEAETALQIVLGAIVQRITPDEAKDLIAQLPSLLQPSLRALPRGPNRQITRQVIETELCERLGIHPARAEQVMSAVGGLIAQSVSPGQVRETQNQLPLELRDLLTASAPAT